MTKVEMQFMRLVAAIAAHVSTRQLNPQNTFTALAKAADRAKAAGLHQAATILRAYSTVWAVSTPGEAAAAEASFYQACANRTRKGTPSS